MKRFQKRKGNDKEKKKLKLLKNLIYSIKEKSHQVAKDGRGE